MQNLSQLKCRGDRDRDELWGVVAQDRTHWINVLDKIQHFRLIWNDEWPIRWTQKPDSYALKRADTINGPLWFSPCSICIHKLCQTRTFALLGLKYLSFYINTFSLKPPSFQGQVFLNSCHFSAPVQNTSLIANPWTQQLLTRRQKDSDTSQKSKFTFQGHHPKGSGLKLNNQVRISHSTPAASFPVILITASVNSLRQQTSRKRLTQMLLGKKD